MNPVFWAIPLALVEMATFYWWHWPHRRLLPERFRVLLMAKGAFRGLATVGLTAILASFDVRLGWTYLIAHFVLGGWLHVRWCRKHGIDPWLVQPRDRYVLATASWVERMIELKEKR